MHIDIGSNPLPKRSNIMVSAMQPELFSKAIYSGADVVCIELEDGIALDNKEIARENVRAFFSATTKNETVEHALRVNCLRTEIGIKDIQMVLDLQVSPTALIIPKVIGPDEIKTLDSLLTNNGSSARLHVMIETAMGLDCASEIARSSDRIDALIFGGRDMAAELRCDSTWEALLYARSRVVHAASVGGLDVIDMPFLQTSDAKGLLEETKKSKSLGFTGKNVIHPKHVATVNSVFTPDAREIEIATKVIEAFKISPTGLVIMDGKFIEKPALKSMQRIISIANKSSNTAEIGRRIESVN